MLRNNVHEGKHVLKTHLKHFFLSALMIHFVIKVLVNRFVVYNRENTCVLSEFQKVRYVIVIICSQIMLEQFNTMVDSAP